MTATSFSAPARLLLAIAYPLLAHWASHDGGGWVAALALADLIVFVAIDGLLALRPAVWALVLALAVALGLAAPTPLAQMLLLAPPLYRYTRRLTALWAAVLLLLALINGALATIAVPDGLLARLGHPPAFAITQEQWSWFANLLNYGIVGGLFAAEYLVRRRLFVQRPETGFFDFLRRMARLGPRFWRDLFS